MTIIISRHYNIQQVIQVKNEVWIWWLQDVCGGQSILDIVRLTVQLWDRYNFQTLPFPTYQLKQCSVNVRFPGCTWEVNSHWMYSARQLGGITLLVAPFCLKASGNLCQSQVNRWPLTMFKGLLATYKVLWSDITFVQFWSAFFPASVDFTNCPKGSVAHMCWSHSAVSHCCMQITIWKHSANHVNYYTAFNYTKWYSVLWSWAFPEGELLGVLGCHLKSLTLCSWEQESYPGAIWAYIEDNHIKRRPCPSKHLEVEEFSLSCPGSGWSWSGELNAVSLSAWSKDV